MNLIFSVQTCLCCCLLRVCKCRFLEQEFKGKLSSEPPRWGKLRSTAIHNVSTSRQRNTGAISAYQTPSGVTVFFPSDLQRSQLTCLHIIQYSYICTHFRDANDSGFFGYFLFLIPIQIRERTWTCPPLILPDSRSTDIRVAVADTSTRFS